MKIKPLHPPHPIQYAIISYTPKQRKENSSPNNKQKKGDAIKIQRLNDAKDSTKQTAIQKTTRRKMDG